MLRIGLTGGIGAGKSLLSTTFSQCGGIVVDGDVLAREVVQPGTEGLASLVDAFGRDILLADGALDRQALAAKAFRDDESRGVLNGIVHPLVARRRSEIIAAVSGDAVVVEDIPLLVESGMAPLFPLVVVVHADVELRVRRLVEQRGMAEADARARIAAQASDQQRRAVADVWLDNSGSPEDLVRRARDVWNTRVQPFAHNLAQRQIARAPARLVPADPSWPDQARRIVNRLKIACGHKALRVDHIGSTAVSGFPDFLAKDVIDIQVTVESLDVADELAEPLLAAGYPRPRAHHPGHRKDRRSQHRRPLRPHRQCRSVAQARARLGGSRSADQRAPAGARLAQPTVRPAVRRLAGGQSRRERRLFDGQV
ncbi:dephospho-CoA kinase [Mycobacterium tuberculosis]|nr:dephospho-CoA kinase [Mycobacterium tuberculosis]